MIVRSVGVGAGGLGGEREGKVDIPGGSGICDNQRRT